MLNVDVLVSFCLTPAANNTLITLFIIAEFVLNAVFAVLLVVSPPKMSVTLSGLTLAVDVPRSNKVLVLLLLLLIVLILALCIGGSAIFDEADVAPFVYPS